MVWEDNSIIWEDNCYAMWITNVCKYLQFLFGLLATDLDSMEK